MSRRLQQQVRAKFIQQWQGWRIGYSHASRSPIVVFMLLLVWSVALGWGFTLITQLPAQTQTVAEISPTGTVDVVPERYQLGQELYLKNCATCHIGIPPAVLPTETWRDILQDEQHYGKKLTPLIDPERLLVWEYLRTFSRTQTAEEERTPYRIAQSRYFKALHPRVKLPQPVTMGSCSICHFKADGYDFRSLTSEWQNAP
ncbi:diheme cytochrome C [Argonema antarcticum]|uniref:diheme cytochrome C n=1 Tax=Argonema antarcticum TaxID=2942763 RepID=UPI0020131663|nr:diheme cytochrome C [Argonema antarcticum]MCL1474738.1 diheme cytochrome C [Argonema antarcticum A004/B2]